MRRREAALQHGVRAVPVARGLATERAAPSAQGVARQKAMAPSAAAGPRRPGAVAERRVQRGTAVVLPAARARPTAGAAALQHGVRAVPVAQGLAMERAALLPQAVEQQKAVPLPPAARVAAGQREPAAASLSSDVALAPSVRLAHAERAAPAAAGARSRGPLSVNRRPLVLGPAVRAALPQAGAGRCPCPAC